MRVLHAVNMSFPIAGIINQMTWEQLAARSLGLPWVSKIFGPDLGNDEIFQRRPANGGGYLQVKLDYYRWLLRQMEYYDVLLLRYSPYDPFQLKFLKDLSKPAYLVCHTFEVSEVSIGRGLRPKVKGALERLIGPHAIRQATGVIAVTPEIGAYELERSKTENRGYYVYPNGIHYGDVIIRDSRLDDVPELLFVASEFATWHGLDLLLEQLSRHPDVRFMLHLVGKIPADLLRLATQDSRCVIHGVLNAEEIEDLSAHAWIGLASLAHFRLGMRQACTLKVREYLRSGLPAYANYEEVFDVANPFYKNGPCDLLAIIDFAIASRSVGRGLVSQRSRDSIEKRVLLDRLYHEIALNC